MSNTSSTPSEPLSEVALALGRIPTGLYIVSAAAEGAPVGFVGSFAMQNGFEPPVLSVAVGKARGPLEAIRAAGHFALSVLDDQSRDVMGAFFRKYEAGQGPFDELATDTAPSGAPVLSGALAWLDCRLQGEYDAGDHVVLFGVVESAQRLREGDPAVHLRKNGLGY